MYCEVQIYVVNPVLKRKAMNLLAKRQDPVESIKMWLFLNLICIAVFLIGYVIMIAMRGVRINDSVAYYLLLALWFAMNAYEGLRILRLARNRA